jgi:ABC-type transport system substrate-binding protein
MSTVEQQIRDAIQEAIAENEVILFMKGTPEAPRCGFSARTVATLEALGAQVRTTTNNAARARIYRQIQLGLNQRGPFVPLIQPTQVFAATSDLQGAVFNPLYSIDVRLPRPA